MGELRQQLTTETRNGEVTINLLLTIRIESDGTIGLSAAASPTPPREPGPRSFGPTVPPPPPDDDWAVPDLGDEPAILIEFGKEVEGR